MESEVSPSPFELVLHSGILLISDRLAYDRLRVVNRIVHLVWDILPEPFCRRLWRLESLVTSAPLGPVLALLFRASIPDLGVLLLGGCNPRHLRLWGLSVGFVLSYRFIHGDTLVLCLPAGFLSFDSFVMSKVFDILGVVIGVLGLGLWRRMELFCRGSQGDPRRRPGSIIPSWCKKNSGNQKRGFSVRGRKRRHSKVILTTFDIVMVSLSA